MTTRRFGMRMRAGLLCLLVVTWPVLAQDKSRKAPPPPPKMTAEQKQQALKTSCNKEADALKLKSKARQSFLAGCLNEPAPAADAKAAKADAKGEAKADAKADAKAKKP